MSVVRLVTLVLVAGATCCLSQDLTENPDTPEYLLVANHFAEILTKDIERKLAPIAFNIEALKRELRETCNTQQVVDISALSPPVGIDHTTKLEEIERKLNEALQKTEALEGTLLEKFEDLKSSTAGQIADLQDDISNQISEGARRVEGLAFTKEEMEEAVRHEAAEVKDMCRDDPRLTALQNNVLEAKELMEEVKGESVEIKSKVEHYVNQNVSQEVNDVKNFVEVMVQEVERLAANSRNFSSTLEEITNSVHLLTATPPPPPQEEEEEEEEEELTGPVYPCVDSVFTGTQSVKVCEMAARFNKCRLPLVSYHCCDTCTSRGLIPEMGAWRHLNLTRHVKSFQVISVFAP